MFNWFKKKTLGEKLARLDTSDPITTIITLMREDKECARFVVDHCGYFSIVGDRNTEQTLHVRGSGAHSTKWLTRDEVKAITLACEDYVLRSTQKELNEGRDAMGKHYV